MKSGQRRHDVPPHDGTLPADALTVLSSATPELSDAEAEAVVRTHYGIEARPTALRSERDQNFLMTEEDGQRYVFKISNGAQDAAVAAFQTAALLHLAAAAPNLPVPHVVGTAAGAPELHWRSQDGVARIGRLVTYMAGAPMAAQPRSARQIAAFGRLAAQVGLGLRDFAHPGADHALLWDLKQAGQTRVLLPFIESDLERRQITAVIDGFDGQVAPALARLRAQVIHCDLNPSNVLIDPDAPELVRGIIDFGDMVHSALINDVAIASAYLVGGAPDPLEPICAFVAAYHAVTPLTREELAVLPQLIATRYALTLAITAWRAGTHPENRDYILRNRGAAVAGMAAITATPPAVAEATFLRACGLD